MNVLFFIAGVLTIRNGARMDHLGVMNVGLLILATHIICRFFDAELSFVLRGIIFMALGAAFLGVNFFLVRKRRQAKPQEEIQ